MTEQQPKIPQIIDIEQMPPTADIEQMPATQDIVQISATQDQLVVIHPLKWALGGNRYLGVHRIERIQELIYDSGKIA